MLVLITSGADYVAYFDHSVAPSSFLCFHVSKIINNRFIISTCKQASSLSSTSKGWMLCFFLFAKLMPYRLYLYLYFYLPSLSYIFYLLCFVFLFLFSIFYLYLSCIFCLLLLQLLSSISIYLLCLI